MSRQTRQTSGRRLQFEPLESRCMLSTGEGTSAFAPPPHEDTPTNPVQAIRVIVLNFEPTVARQGNRTLWDLFNWNDPRDLAAGFIADMERESGGAIDYQVVEWRDLNEFPIFTSGFRYTADQYVQNRTTNTGWVDGVADFYAIAEQQGLAELVNNNVIDEIWTFGDHYFNLLGEAWMAGPRSFFINGPSFPEFPVDRAVAGFGFSYERGVAEMLHNNGHRTENHMSRAFGGWNVTSPTTPWDLFTANEGQTNRTTFGVGSTHFPFNAASDYDYANTRTFASYADDFVLNYPNQTYATAQLSRAAWGSLGVGDWHRGYMQWFFGHLPRDSGTSFGGRQNNWYEYIYDFNSYRPTTGLPRDNEAILGAYALERAGVAGHEFTLRFYDVQGINPSSLDGTDVLVSGPGGFSQLASLVEIESEQATTAGTARTVRYRITAPGGSWDFADSGTYSVSLRASQVRDAAGAFLPAASLGTFQVNIPTANQLDVAGMLAGGAASVAATNWDVGGPDAIFDPSTSSLYRTPGINPAVVTLSFDEPQTLSGFRALFSHASGNPAYRWIVEAADSLADLNSQSGSYRVLVRATNATADVFSNVNLLSSATALHVRLTATRLTGDNFVHINAWQLLSIEGDDAAIPTAGLRSTPTPVANQNVTTFQVRYEDDRAIDVRTVNFGDVRVTGPDGFVQTAALSSLNVNANGPQRDVVYFISAPGGTWDNSDRGAYTIELLPQQVFDAAGNPVAPAVLGSFIFGPPPALLGDYNTNGVVDAADCTVWRDALGAVVTPFSGADGDGDGVVDQGDYDVWKANFGNQLVVPPATAGVSSAADASSAVMAESAAVTQTVLIAEPAAAARSRVTVSRLLSGAAAMPPVSLDNELLASFLKVQTEVYGQRTAEQNLLAQSANVRKELAGPEAFDAAFEWLETLG